MEAEAEVEEEEEDEDDEDKAGFASDDEADEALVIASLPLCALPSPPPPCSSLLPSSSESMIALSASSMSSSFLRPALRLSWQPRRVSCLLSSQFCVTPNCWNMPLRWAVKARLGSSGGEGGEREEAGSEFREGGAENG